MFEAAELGLTVSREEYQARVPPLRADLLQVQRQLLQASFPVIIVFAGVDGAGKSETVNLLHAWMDPRWLVTHAFGEPSDEEAERPEYWRYWRTLPPRGRVGLFLSSWYSKPVLDRAHRRDGARRFEERLARIAEFEKCLADDGALILKFWMHLGKAAQKKRLKKLENDPLTRWRVTKLQWKHWRMYARFVEAAERAIERTSTGQAPWRIVEGLDERYRSLTVTTLIRDAIRSVLGNSKAKAARPPAPTRARPRGRRGAAAAAPPGHDAAPRTGSHPTVLARLDMSKRLDKQAYPRRLEKYQGVLNRLHRQAHDKGVSTVLVFEGWDASGKGGVIRRVTAALDARAYQVIPIAVPTDEERAHHYLWRFWRHLSRAGRVTIFDRSWYGRVLVERVEGLASPDEWLRAYSEINQFEAQLVEHGVVLLKFWMHVTKGEQLRRFRERARLAYKRWKLTKEDWRNRERWADYERAVDEMVARTSTRRAPWTLVEGNDKAYTRIKVIRTICDRLGEALA